MKYEPIGVIHTDLKKREESPIQPAGARGINGYIEIYPEYEKGLEDLEGFSHIYLIYHFHLSDDYSLSVKPFMDSKKHGLFATRAPKRPNPIGISVVRVVDVDKNIVHIKDADIVDGTPLLDIKPYVPDMIVDDKKDIKIGWLENNIHKVKTKKSDSRFTE
ncbi:tRNA (N6-threonylcarbamoyladenosine(37)-N6)-methyltransferase TrmO [Methanohalobium sp.]|uniref:tRNA (N6-threonylcarbamoyladenosine(37)-N6)-methyltransferase TrmO n=1 Tax=Methanohalobium sp. TaxID=2837493 RepID=UPI0025D5898C|nr:tRNA (N6-threonylcarbamoyladenosine(37)-N6)-methyltransferase TrmO [Methanohalobium sp.]